MKRGRFIIPRDFCCIKMPELRRLFFRGWRKRWVFGLFDFICRGDVLLTYFWDGEG